MCARVSLLGAGSKANAAVAAAAERHDAARELRQGDGAWQGTPCAGRRRAMSTVVAVARLGPGGSGRGEAAGAVLRLGLGPSSGPRFLTGGKFLHV